VAPVKYLRVPLPLRLDEVIRLNTSRKDDLKEK
jgi:hypothetical protein